MGKIQKSMEITCKWERENTSFYDNNEWYTECKKELMFEFHPVVDNGYVFCPYCGKKIELLESDE